MAAFELILMVESTRVRQQSEPLREALLSQAVSLAAELGDEQREGLVWQLRGMAAAQAGQEGEALYLYQRAVPLLTGRFDRAELLFNMATAAFQTMPQVFAGRDPEVKPPHLDRCITWDTQTELVQRLYPLHYRPRAAVSAA